MRNIWVRICREEGWQAGERVSTGCVCGPACGEMNYGISFASQVLHGACIHAASCKSSTQYIWQVGEGPSLMAEKYVTPGFKLFWKAEGQ